MNLFWRRNQKPVPWQKRFDMTAGPGGNADLSFCPDRRVTITGFTILNPHDLSVREVRSAAELIVLGVSLENPAMRRMELMRVPLAVIGTLYMGGAIAITTENQLRLRLDYKPELRAWGDDGDVEPVALLTRDLTFGVVLTGFAERVGFRERSWKVGPWWASAELRLAMRHPHQLQVVLRLGPWKLWQEVSYWKGSRTLGGSVGWSGSGWLGRLHLTTGTKVLVGREWPAYSPERTKQ